MMNVGTNTANLFGVPAVGKANDLVDLRRPGKSDVSPRVSPQEGVTEYLSEEGSATRPPSDEEKQNPIAEKPLHRIGDLLDHVITFEIDEETGALRLLVLDRGSDDEVIYQIPPEAVEEFVARYHEVRGLCVDEEA
jgi:uncharacterized FlaG/YvyC family protein